MSSKLTRLIVLELMRPIVLVGSVIEKVQKLVFGGSEVRRSRERDEQFGLEIQQNIPFLFDQYAGRIRLDETIQYPRPFDYTVAIVALDDLLFRFIRGRGEFRVQVAPEASPTDWEDLPLVLGMIDAEFERREFASFSDVEAALKPRMQYLQEAFSIARYSELRDRLSEVHKHERAVMRQWETEIRRKL